MYICVCLCVYVCLSLSSMRLYPFSVTIQHDKQEVVRTEVIMLDVEESAEVWKDIIFRTRHTLYPVCQGSADKVIGVMNAKDYFRLDSRDLETVMKQAVSPAYFVPDTIKADVLFRNMKKRKEIVPIWR